ncbi:short-chain dehydrogenase [Pseudorhodoferax aquiterrae]|uniref:Short-chain dehydrogenase n=1 Tax=Pseudorhodoferax aquiterrae TaxID=747304 RepID=A0ABQ3G255_9BURK|nr:SDR family NAD(P)-dependent oxidoreductase [Pseudorhodoferax aquiterrae]GHC84511.1 short-chain dehydrogenase [Pseudorhodoferax aquiterrae]
MQATASHPDSPSPPPCALVTGAGSGLGAAIARSCHAAGWRVGLLDVAGQRAQALAEELDPGGGSTLVLQAEVGDFAAAERAVAQLAERFGGIGALVNNAGTDVTAPLDEIEVGAWQRVLGTNLLGPFHLAKAALPWLRAADAGRGGQIVNIASTAALRSWPNASAYHASKWGLLGLSRALHAELRGAGIRVGTVVAGGMRTPFLLDRFPDLDPSRLQDPAQVAAAVQFMLAMPRGSVVAEIMVLPEQESSWP